jgi:hypothetical protein
MFLKCSHSEVTMLLVKVQGGVSTGRLCAVCGTSWNRLRHTSGPHSAVE